MHDGDGNIYSLAGFVSLNSFAVIYCTNFGYLIKCPDLHNKKERTHSLGQSATRGAVCLRGRLAGPRRLLCPAGKSGLLHYRR